MKTNPVGWFEIYVQDLPRAKRFYETVFATELQPLNAPFPGIGLWAFPMAQDSYGAAGGQVEKTKMSIGEYGFISLLRDPDGNMIGLHSMR